MLAHVRAFLRDYRQLMVVGALLLASAFAVGLYIVRVTLTDNYLYTFLVWNLFLAWLPMFSALAAYNLHKHDSRRSGLLVFLCAIAWLLFMPNAPYLVTDIVNIHSQPNMPFWYDILMFAMFAWAGMFLGLVSLFLMQEIVRKLAGRVFSWLFAISVLGLSSFGIYLGRFMRWNSWDIFTSPRELLGDIVSTVRHPVAHFETYMFSAIFAFFIISIYLMLMAMMNFRQDAHGQ